MDITDGETTGDDGLPGPASRKLQGTNAEKRKSGKRKAETRSPVGHLTPEQLAATQQYLQTQFKSLTTAIMVLLTGGVACLGSAHLDQHNNDGSHKTVQMQPGGRREENSGQVLPDGPSDEVQGAEGGAKGTSNIQHSTPNTQAGVEGGIGERMHQMMLGFQQQLVELRAEMRGQRDLLQQMDLNFEKVANNQSFLRLENEELRQLNAEGYLNFAVRVKGDDFLAFAVTMALGNRHAAARHLGIPQRNFYYRVNGWARGSKDHQRMFRLVEWRKKTGRKIIVRLDDSVQSGEPNDEAENPVTMAAVLEGIATSDSRDYPAILREILEVLQMQNPENWAKLGREAIGIIRDEIG